jgi:gamma-glutamyltranspeptidase/glutathione hydrolase
VSAGSHTTAVVVVDGAGNALVLLQSLRNPFGSGVVAGTTGILLQNRGRDFSLDPDHVNAIAPGKRTLHTLSPAMLLEGGLPRLGVATIGGHKQTFGTQQVLVNHLVFGMDLQSAIDAPRWALGEDNRALHLEPALSPVAGALAARGHQVAIGGTTFGGSQAVSVDRATGVRAGASDSRYDGIALGY